MKLRPNSDATASPPHRRTSLLVALAWAGFASLATAETLEGLFEDRGIREDGVLKSVRENGLLPGGSGSPALDRSPVAVFQLPDFGTVSEPFTSARFEVEYVDSTGRLDTIDLYGLGRRTSPDVQAADYYGETGVLDPTDATLLQNDFLFPDLSFGIIGTDPVGSKALCNYLNLQYANGEGAGDYVFLRLSSDEEVTGVSRYVVTARDHPDVGESRVAPAIVYNEGPSDNDWPERPFLWVRDSDRADILEKVDNHAWAQALYNNLVGRMEPHVVAHEEDRRQFLSELPVVNWSEAAPLMKTIPAFSESSVRWPLRRQVIRAQDCAVLYYLTGESRYAGLAADVLHNCVKTMAPLTPSENRTNGGLIFQNNFLKEARTNGTQLQIVYDILRDYLLTRPVYDMSTDSMVNFNFGDAQSLFETFYDLALNRGFKNNNWSSLMSSTMLHSLLAMEDNTAREAMLQVFLETGSSRQASLAYELRNYRNPGEIWPETFQYNGAVANTRTYQMVMLDRIDPSSGVFERFLNISLSLARPSEFRYPNGELIRFGDGPRTINEPFRIYEQAYQQAKARGLTEAQTQFGAWINRGIALGRYSRSSPASYSSLSPSYEAPTQLLWQAGEVIEDPEDFALPRTDSLSHAGVTLQRNPVSDPDHGLMSFVGGGSFTHSHASGLSMEIYGVGEVLGAKGGRGSYQTRLHEDYYRVFASNNTVIVNGASRGQGNWQQVGINRVQSVAMEPAPKAPAVSSDFSFTCSSFEDDRGNLAEASQQRTMAIVRTSPTTGFYVDVFRSDSRLPDEFHDYIYRNVGESDFALRSAGASLLTAPAPGRFQNDLGDEYQQPGWRYFTNTEVSAPIADPVQAQFVATLGGREHCMSMHMPAVADREYARVESPSITDAPGSYASQNAPAIVVRQQGEAWKRPFLAVFEPHFESDGGTIRNVQTIEDAGGVKGVKIESRVDGEQVTHYVLSQPNANSVFFDDELGLSFAGRFGIVEKRESGRVKLYLGQGSELEYQSYRITSDTGGNTRAEVRFAPYFEPRLTSSTSVSVGQPALTGYRAWAATEAPNSLPGGDFDGDGVSNALEYVLGGEAGQADLDKLPRISEAGDHFEFKFKRARASLDGTTRLTVELTNNLSDWEETHVVPDEASENANRFTVIENDPAGYDTIRFMIEKSTADRKLIRLKTQP